MMTSVRLIFGISEYTRDFREHHMRVNYPAGTSIKIRSDIISTSCDIPIYVRC